jgi:FkbM family methyltransferase
MGIKSIVRNLLAKFDIGVYSINNRTKWEEKQKLWMKELNIRTILDIGANIGQFATTSRNIFPNARIYSFEPLPSCYTLLKEKFKDDNNITVFPFALGDKEEIVEINEHNFSPSSSLLDMLDLHKKALPVTAKHHKTSVQVKRLDDFEKEIILQKPVLLKLDVQGYESKVIAGGEKIIDAADYLMVELSFVPLYDKQPLFDDIYTLLKNKGFELRGCYEAFANNNTGAILQSDGFFVKVR